MAAYSKTTLGTAAIRCVQRRHCHVYGAKSNLLPRKHNFVLGSEFSLQAFRTTTYTKDGFTGRPLATYEHRNTVQMYSHSPASNRPGTQDANFGAVENGENCGQHIHCCWSVSARSWHEQDCHVWGLNQ